jgi:hypothetical protein
MLPDQRDGVVARWESWASTGLRAQNAEHTKFGACVSLLQDIDKTTRDERIEEMLLVRFVTARFSMVSRPVTTRLNKEKS